MGPEREREREREILERNKARRWKPATPQTMTIVGIPHTITCIG